MFAEIRQKLHQMEYFDFLSGAMVKEARLLVDGDGLSRIIDSSKVKSTVRRSNALGTPRRTRRHCVRVGSMGRSIVSALDP